MINEMLSFKVKRVKMTMKSIIFFLFFIFGITNITFAQKLIVESLKNAESDLSVQTQPRKDLNDKNCALVKVGIGLQGVQFEGNIVGNVVNKTGEYWVYMPQGSRMLKVKHPNYSPVMVSFPDFGIEKLAESRTYELQITSTSQQL